MTAYLMFSAGFVGALVVLIVAVCRELAAGACLERRQR